ncbi:MAG: penicillin-binding protein 1A, partial [Gammaproteobacteria bacterium]
MKPVHVRLLSWAASLIGGGVALILLLGVGTYYYLAPGLPDVEQLRDTRMQLPLRVYSRDGQLLAQIGDQRRIPVKFEEIPDRVVQAFIDAEDDRFFDHGGIDLTGVVRLVVLAPIKGRNAPGGSTITQQLARNVFPIGREKELKRKLREIFLSFRLESEFTKQEILTLYLNKIYLGEKAYGVAAAAETYFGKRLEDLTIAEAATLGGLPQRPAKVNPVANPEAMRHRRAYVLRRMLTKGHITEEEYNAALEAPVRPRPYNAGSGVDAPYVAEMVRTALFEEYGEALYTDGYQVTTTIDARLQRAADVALRSTLLEYDRRHGWRGPVARGVQATDEDGWREVLVEVPRTGGLVPAVVTGVAAKSVEVYTKDGEHRQVEWEDGLVWARKPGVRGGVGPSPKTAAEILRRGDIVYTLPAGPARALLVQVPAVQGAFVALDPEDGAVIALSGGFDYTASKFNRAVQSKRQVGSAFKPFLYSAALDAGLTPASIILDAPVVYEGGGDLPDWRPENDNGEFTGPTRLREALVRSRNLVSIRVLRQLGVETATASISRFGFSEAELPRDLTMALGTAQLAPIRVATGYAVFANGGYQVSPYLIERVEGPDGKVLQQARPRLVCRDCAGAAPAELSSTAPLRTIEAGPGVTRLAEIGGTGSRLDPERIAPRVLDPANAYLMTDMMRDVIRRGTAMRALALNRTDLAGKTGTTNEYVDAWFCGYQMTVAACAWVGFDQPKKLGDKETGGAAALPMWIGYMNR